MYQFEYNTLLSSLHPSLLPPSFSLSPSIPPSSLSPPSLSPPASFSLHSPSPPLSSPPPLSPPSQNSFSYELMLAFGRELSCNKFGSMAYKKVLTMQSTFIKTMEELFPWFSVDNISITSPSHEVRNITMGGAKEGAEKRSQEREGTKL